MNNHHWITPRKRRKHLFIVEGKNEKNELMKLILRAFPEINMELDNILIYGTNIYMLYYDIVKTYQSDWYNVDVDLPYIVSLKLGIHEPLFKNDFTDIVLIFDYERHDPNFSEEKIVRMQNYFQDATDVGKLFINYPMIESYQHFMNFPEEDFMDRHISVTLQPGHYYKNLVKDTLVAKAVDLPHKLKAILSGRFQVANVELCEICIENLLKVNDLEKLDTCIEVYLSKVLSEKNFLTAKYQLVNTIQNIGYLNLGMTYYEYMRSLFKKIIYHNICKANKIQMDTYEINTSMAEEYFYNLNLTDILLEQNMISRNAATGIIWVLNTSVFFVPDYNFHLLNS